MLFAGWSRKCVIPSLVVFSLGWVTYVVGFILFMVDGDGKRSSSNPNFDRIPYFLAVTSGPFLVLTALLHAALSGPFSAILGLVTSLISVVCFSGFGYVLYVSSVSVYDSIHHEKGVDVKSTVMFVGSLIAGFSWMLVMMAWHFFVYDWKVIESNDNIVDEEGNFAEPPPIFRNTIFSGIARKVAAVVLLVLAASWCLFLTGLDDEIHSNYTAHASPANEVSLQFSLWTLSVVGLLVILAAAGHAGSYGGASTAMGVCTSLLGMLFLTSLGYTTHHLSMGVYHKCHHGVNCYIVDTSIPSYMIYQLSGSVGMCLAWACVLALWPFYFKVTQRVLTARRRRRRQQDYLRQVQDDSLDERLPLLYNETTPLQHRPSISVL